MTARVTYRRDGDIAILSLNQPPVNALGQPMREGLQQAFRKALADDQVTAIIIASEAKIFCGGADISEFGTDRAFATPSLPSLLEELEASTKPVVAAIQGSALGGGLELAMACDYRIADTKARLGLPEVNLGLIPGAGGTQRLPRLAGVNLALDMTTSGKPIDAEQAESEGLIDRLSEGVLLDSALAYARELIDAGAPVRSCGDIRIDMHVFPASGFNDFRAAIARKTRGFFAPERCIQAIEAACKLPLAEGLAREQALFRECMNTPQARAQQHLFFAEREALKVRGVAPATKPRAIRSVAVIGAGTMGGGIAMNFANAGIPVKMLELKQDALDRGLATIRTNYEISARKGRITAAQVGQRMALLEGTLSYDDLANADLVIEAVFESMEVKQAVFSRLDEVCKPGAILASNTSTLDLDRIASFTSRPQDVIGLHFFSPANVMRLLEIVRGEQTADDVIVTALQVAKTIRKVPVVVGVCFGFVGNRMLEPYGREAHRLLLEGATPAQVDKVLTDFGLAMGPLSTFDLAGNDVTFLVRESRRDAIAHDPSYNKLGDELYQLGRYGQKTGRGFYIYQGRDKKEDPELIQLAESVARDLGIERREISDQEIYERCVYMLINEAADILSEGIASRPGDCDLVWVNGYGFPAWRGGPMQYADEIGLGTVLEGIEKYRRELGEHGEMWFQPSNLLRELVAAGKSFRDFSLANS